MNRKDKDRGGPVPLEKPREARFLGIGAVFVLVVGLLVSLDLWLKAWSSANLAGAPPRVLIDGVLGLTYFHNTGAAFGFLGGFGWGRWVITGFVILVLVAVLWYYFRLPATKKMWWLRVPMLMIFAGGLGNLIDRVRLGHVVDMLEFLFVRFAIFNLADVFVTTGAVLTVAVVMAMGKNAPWPFGEQKHADAA